MGTRAGTKLCYYTKPAKIKVHTVHHAMGICKFCLLGSGETCEIYRLAYVLPYQDISFMQVTLSHFACQYMECIIIVKSDVKLQAHSSGKHTVVMYGFPDYPISA